ncbi:MAG: hypothetical protein AAF600_02730 [Bacteroidota bacterium]
MRLLLQGAGELFDEGKITADEFAILVDGVEKDYNRIVSEMETKEMTELLLGYLDR